MKDRFVVRSDDVRLAVTPVMAWMSFKISVQLGFVPWSASSQSAAQLRVLQDGVDGVTRLTQVSLAGEIQAPNQVPFGARRGLWFLILQSLHFDLIPMLADQLVDEGSADCHMFLAGETSIESLSALPGAGFSHEDLEADDFASYPGWLGSGAKRDPHRFMEFSIVVQAVARDGLGETDEVEEQHEEKREACGRPLLSCACGRVHHALARSARKAAKVHLVASGSRAMSLPPRRDRALPQYAALRGLRAGVLGARSQGGATLDELHANLREVIAMLLEDGGN